MEDLVSGAGCIMVILGFSDHSGTRKVLAENMPHFAIILMNFGGSSCTWEGAQIIRHYCYDVPGHISMECSLTSANKRC